VMQRGGGRGYQDKGEDTKTLSSAARA
jgi:hypothetical protein